LTTIPENRIYVSAERVAAFTHDFIAFSHGKVVSDDTKAPGIEIGRPDETFHRLRIESVFGRMTVLVTDGHLPFPYGRDTTGYKTSDLNATLDKAKESGAQILVAPYQSGDRRAAMVEFPGGYIAEIHTVAAK
jgi:hypothetical protein